MKDIISTESIGRGIADVIEDFVLEEKPESRLVFHAQIHKGGIRGRLIRQRRESKVDIWVPDEAIDIRTLGKREMINIEVSTDAVQKMYSAIEKLVNILQQRGVDYGKNSYVVADPDSAIVTDKSKASYVKKIIEAGYDEELLSELIESNPDSATRLVYAKIEKQRREALDELAHRLREGSFAETIGDDSWQKWIYKNSWLFGANYKVPVEKSKINISGSMPDYLFPTLDGFVDLLEIKLPRDEVILRDSNHTGSWRWSPEVNKAIGQVVNYLGEIDSFRDHIEKNVERIHDLKLSLLKPRAYILIGDSTNWDDDKKEGLRKLNHVLHSVEVLTYKELLDRGSRFYGSNSLNEEQKEEIKESLRDEVKQEYFDAVEDDIRFQEWKDRD